MTQNDLHLLLEYKDGSLYWKVNRGLAKAGSRAGSEQPSGYRKIRVCGKPHQEHRIIWMWHYGDIPKNMEIDHIDRNPSNNKIENLRLRNRSKNCLNNSGNNVSFRPREKTKQYQSRVRVDGKEHTKYFLTYEEAKIHSVNLKNSIINDDLEPL